MRDELPVPHLPSFHNVPCHALELLVFAEHYRGDPWRPRCLRCFLGELKRYPPRKYPAHWRTEAGGDAPAWALRAEDLLAQCEQMLTILPRVANNLPLLRDLLHQLKADKARLLSSPPN